MLSPDRIIETDGVGANLMKVVCAWCKKDLGAKACVPEMVGKISHGICPACADGLREEARTAPRPIGRSLFLPGSGRSLPTFRDDKHLPGGDASVNEVASPLARDVALPGETGTARSAEESGAASDEHAGACPATFTFSTVTGSDFGRSNAWAKQSGNALTKIIRRRLGP
jgi:hypothetical protein